MVPFDDKSPFVTSGIRVGTAAITTRGMKEGDMEAVVQLIDEAIQFHEDDKKISGIAHHVYRLMENRPLFKA